MKLLKRFLAGAVSFSIIFTFMGTVFAQREEQMDEVPVQHTFSAQTKFEPWKMIYNADFSDGVVDNHIDTISGYHGEIYEENNMLNIDMSNFEGSGLKISPVAPKVKVTQDCVIEYTIYRKTNKGQILDRIGCDAYGTGLTDIQVHAGGSALAAYRTSLDAGADNTRKSVGGVGDNEHIKFVIYARFSTGKMDIYINDRLVVDDQYMRDSIDGFSFINLFYDCEYRITRYAVKDMKVYLVNDGEMTDEQRVEADYQALEWPFLWREGGAEVDGMYSGNLCLYEVAGNGSDVTWSSSDPEIVSEDGYINCKTPQDVTVTATIKSGEAVRTKEFTFTPLPSSIDINETPSVEEIIYENDFETDAEFTYEIYTNNYATGDVRIENGKLVTERGEAAMGGPTIYFNTKGRVPVKGLIGVDLDWEKEGEAGAWLRCGPVYFNWRSDGYLLIQTCSDPGSINVVTKNAGNYKEAIHIQFVYDTTTSQISVWVNKQNQVKKSYARLAAQTTFLNWYTWAEAGTISYDNCRIYYAMPPVTERLDYETTALTYHDLLTEPFLAGNVISSDRINLPDKGKYGSDITWISDNPEVIDETGRVNKTGWSENPTVTITAVITCGGLTAKKSFPFTVLRDISGDPAEADMQDLKETLIVNEKDDGREGITLALCLMPDGLRGSQIMWTTDNPQVITSAGRVIRPKAGSGDQEVTVTADFGGGLTKSFTFRVLEDKFVDMQYHEDEDFFGAWENGAWKKHPKINYYYNNDKNLALAEDAAKSGDYALTKEYLLAYWRTRRKTSTENSRFPLGAKIVGGHIYHENMPSEIAVGTGVIKEHEFEKTEIDLANYQLFNNNASMGITMMSLYSDNGTIRICSSEYPVEQMRPKLQLIVNGATKTYDITEDVTIRAGENEDVCYGQDEILTVRMFGEFMGDESARTLMRLNFDYIDGAVDKITSAKLILHSKIEEPYIQSKEFAVMLDKASFSEDSSWSGITGFLYSWDGYDGKNTWDTPRYASSEYLSQMCRFNYNSNLIAEYSYTKDEEYAYLLISEAMDFLADQGMERTYSANTGAGTSRSLYGNYLACAGRGGFYKLITSDVIDSDYMSPYVFGTLLKSSWDYLDVMYRTDLGIDMVNWAMHYYLGLIQASAALPEFLIADDVFERCRLKFEELMVGTTFEDGSYKEAATSYTGSTLGTYRRIKQTLREYGFDTTEAYDERLHKSGLYNLLLSGARYTRWGDSGITDNNGRIEESLYQPFVQFFRDYEMQYIGTYGSKGVEPAWMSKLYQGNMTCFMRSDWSKNQTFMFINARGPSNHAHADDNNLVLTAKNRVLLIDPGVGTYDAENYQRQWLTSTIAHNTVEINGESQIGSGILGDYGLQGKLYNWSTSQDLDFLSQNTISYRDHEHRRTITFIKPDFIIISDRLTPKDVTSSNTYRQAWHFPVAANMTYDAEKNSAKTNYTSGANLYVASTAGEANLKEEMGMYDYGAGSVGENIPFICYDLENVSGTKEIDTVLLPYEGKGDVTVERLENSYDPSVVSTLKINIDRDGVKTTSYYALNYETGSQQEISFGAYKTDGTMAVVTVDDAGKIKEVSLSGGSYIKNAQGENIVKYSDVIENIHYTIIGDSAIVTVGDNIQYNAADISIYADNTLKTVKLGGSNRYFTQDGKIITLSDKTYEDPFVEDNNKGEIVTGNGPGGSSGNSGTEENKGDPGNPGGEDPAGSSTVTPAPEQEMLNDISGHWAYEDISGLYRRKLINGYEDGSFQPDKNITRAEFITMAVNMFGDGKAVEYSKEFSDVSENDWYAGAIAKAVEMGIITRDTCFRPNENISREEICTVAIRLLEKTPENRNTNFLDHDEISSWAVPYVSAASEMNIVGGYEDGSFRGKNHATRAEAVVILNRVWDAGEQK